MKKHAVYLCCVLTCVAILAGGCANRDAVKKDRPLAPQADAAGPAKAEPAQARQAEAQQGEKRPAMQGVREGTDQALEPVSSAGELTAHLESIHFDFDSYALSGQARDILARNAELLKQGGAAKVRVAGHCDERGSDDYNLALSERRAKAAMQYLAALGVPRERLSVIGYGKEKPAVLGHDEASWAENRRGDFEAPEQRP